MLTNLIDDDQPSIPIIILAGKDALDLWLKKQPKRVKNWVLATGFEANEGTTCLIADVTGNIEIVLGGAGDDEPANLWLWSSIHDDLPEGNYRLDESLGEEE